MVVLLSFFMGMAQVSLVAFQTRQIAHKAPLWQIVLVGALISTVWVFNVRSANTDLEHAVSYIAGAAAGTTLAMLIPLRKSKP